MDPYPPANEIAMQASGRASPCHASGQSLRDTVKQNCHYWSPPLSQAATTIGSNHRWCTERGTGKCRDTSRLTASEPVFPPRAARQPRCHPPPPPVIMSEPTAKRAKGYVVAADRHLRPWYSLAP